jgi:hypothetical protein
MEGPGRRLRGLWESRGAGQTHQKKASHEAERAECRWRAGEGLALVLVMGRVW